MKPNRRTFLRQAGTLIALGVVMPAPSLRAAVPPGPSSLGVLTDSSGWSIRRRCLGWAKMVADIRRLSSDSVAQLAPTYPQVACHKADNQKSQIDPNRSVASLHCGHSWEIRRFAHRRATIRIGSRPPNHCQRSNSISA